MNGKGVAMFNDFKLKNFNFRLLLYAIALSVIGVLVVQSATANFAESLDKKQSLGVVLGVIVLLIVAVFNYNYLLKLSWVVYFGILGLLAAVLVFGESVNNAKRWIKLPVIGQFQPSEIAKIGLIIFFAMFLTMMKDRINKITTLLMVFGILAVPLGLIILQPNLSTTIVIIIMIISMIFAAGISMKWVLGVLAVVVPSVTLLIYMVSQEKQTFLQPYQRVRIMSWINPAKFAESYYQQKNSITAIGSGMLWGKGLNNLAVNSVKNGNFLSEVQTDFIFAIVGEEMGFIGSMLVVGLLALIIFECLLTAARTKDLKGRLICVGMATLIGFQGFTNIAVATGMFPNTGLPLPFVSYGVTSLISMYIGIGLVINVGLYGRH